MPSTATSILDGLSTSVAVKAPCRTVATSNITLAGLQTISGYTTVENDRVLVKGQTNSVDNGIYMASTGNWTRAKDADGNRDLVQGTRVLVRSTTVDGAEYELTTPNPIVIGTSELTFELRYSSNVTYDQTEGEINAGVTPIDHSKKPGNIRRYFQAGVIDGTTDVAYAFRKALDLAAEDGTTVTCDPPGQLKLGSTIYLPQRLLPAGKRGYLISLYGTTLIGQGRGTGTILESGTGSLSTGGATNFGQGNESDEALHYKTIIQGATFKSCDLALRLFNFTQGCLVRDLWFDDIDRCVVAHRCFYSEFHNLHAQPDSVAAGEVLFDFTEVNNAMVIMGCQASSADGSSPTGIGYRFTGGGAGIVFEGNTAESLDKGVVINGQLDGIDIRQNYFENITTTAIDATAGGAKKMDVDGNWFADCAECIDAVAWTHGTWGRSNHISGTGGTVKVSDDASLCTIEIPGQLFSESTALANAVIVPSNYTLGNSVRLVAPRRVYAGSVGFSAPIAIDQGESLTVPAFAYSGGNGQNGTGFNVPFVTQDVDQVDTSILDTQITWSDYRMMVGFDLYTEINGAKRLRGLILAAGFVHRLDSLSNISITASNNGGKLRLTIAGSDHTGFMSAGFLGQIRHL